MCEIGFMLLHNINMSMLNNIHELFKMGKYDIWAVSKVVYPHVKGNLSYFCNNFLIKKIASV